MKHDLTDIEYANVCQVIAARLGLNLLSWKKNNLSRILYKASVDLGFQNMSSFIQWLMSPDLGDDEFESVAPFFTNSETYFWREPMVFTALTENILPELIALRKDNGKKINIWCAGCSNGEEAYSIAIALYRTIPEIKNWNITILATDINKKSLNNARTGIYGSWSFRNSPLWLRNRYMNQLDNLKWEVIPEIKEMVTFSNFNLTRDNYHTTVCRNLEIDLIFCRNVLMYFTNEWAAKVSQKLFDTLSENGWLIVSSCELSSTLFPEVTPKNFPGAVLYHKSKKYLSESTINANEPVSRAFFNNPYLPDPDIIVKKRTVRSNSQPVTVESLPGIMIEEDDKSKNKNSIRLLADNGHLKEALSACNEAIVSDKLSPGLYFVKASILQEMNEIPEAIKSLKQAIYIDPEYIMGHFTLGNLYTRKGIIKSSKRFFRNALDLLNRISGDTIPDESAGLSARYLREIILANLKTQ